MRPRRPRQLPSSGLWQQRRGRRANGHSRDADECGVSFARHRIDNQLVFAGAGASRPNFKIAPPKVPIRREALI